MNFIVNPPAQLGEILSSAHQAKGLTQAEAAVRIGVGQPRISSLESTGTESLSLSQLLELTALYGLELCIRTKDEREAAEVEW